MKEITQDYFEYWFDFRVGFFRDSKNNLEPKTLRNSAFSLHQTTKSFYNNIILDFSKYKPKLHDIEELGGMAKNYSSELLQVFPIATAERK